MCDYHPVRKFSSRIKEMKDEKEDHDSRVLSGLRSHGAFFTRGSATKNGEGMPGRVENQ
jgi:hypothetical protein